MKKPNLQQEPRAKFAVVDFETEGIEPRPEYPPRPAGVSILYDGVAKYYAWGHPIENNCLYQEAVEALAKLWNDEDITFIFHNAQFDLEVAYQKMGLPELPWYRVHDTMILAFLNNPHSKSLSLKPLADELLGMPPTERDEVRDWIVANVPGATLKNFGKWICKAPGNLVGKYADGDTTRTLELFDKLYPQIQKAGMQEAYDRERQLMPILMENSRLGIPVDMKALKADIEEYSAVLYNLDTWILERLQIDDVNFNIDSDQQMADALERMGLVDEWILTEKGARSMSAEALDKCLKDRVLFGALQYRGPLSTCLHTFMQNWYDTALKSRGSVYCSWNQTRSDYHGGGSGGARTGRLSSTPNFQNIPTNLDSVNKIRPEWCPELPKVRKYIIAPKGYVLLGRDYSAQEVRVFAHYEDAEIAGRYREDAQADVHQFIADLITNSGTPCTRRHAKTILFLTFYGGGVNNLAGQLGVSVPEAQKLKAAFLRVFPALKEMNREMKTRAANNQPIRTLGGRLYYVEPPKVVNGTLRTFDYKLINVLIQGSSADMTKEAMVRYQNTKKSSRLLLSVHDELIILCPKKDVKQEMAILKAAMESIALDVPVLSSGEMGTNWQDMEEVNE